MDLSAEQGNKARLAKSPGELLALARAEGIPMTEEEARDHFARLHPPVGELADDELEAVAGGGCQPGYLGAGGQPPPKFKEGDHVMESCNYVCDLTRPVACRSYYWVIEKAFLERDSDGSKYYLYQFRCPVCHRQNNGRENDLHLVE